MVYALAHAILPAGQPCCATALHLQVFNSCCAAAAAGIKHLHVLPFISQFCLMVHDLEVALVEGTAAAAAVAAAAPQQQQQQRQIEGGGEEEQQSPEEAADAARSVRAGEMGQVCSCQAGVSRVHSRAVLSAAYAETQEQFGQL
jgi:ribosomal protein L12E/L44/L45/RPP1/RPP2